MRFAFVRIRQFQASLNRARGTALAGVAKLSIAAGVFFKSGATHGIAAKFV